MIERSEGNRVETWTELTLFASSMLHAPAGKKGQRLAGSIKNNLQGIVVTAARKQRQPRKNTSDDVIRKGVDLKLQDGDVSGAVRLLPSEDSIAPMCEETMWLSG